MKWGSFANFNEGKPSQYNSVAKFESRYFLKLAIGVNVFKHKTIVFGYYNSIF